MASFAELAEANSELPPEAVAHLQRLVGVWGLPCDLAFADLLLHVPEDSSGSRFVVLGHVRSTTGATVHEGDPVGDRSDDASQSLLKSCWEQGTRFDRSVEDTLPPGALDPTVVEGIASAVGSRSRHIEYIPVRFEGDVIAVLTRETQSGGTRVSSGLERQYHGLFERLALMIEQGSFPGERTEKSGEFREPRVGDGVLVLDRERRVEFVSPNALSAMHRLGVRAELVGRRLDSVGIEDEVVRRALERRVSTITEIEHSDDRSIVLRCHPLLEQGRATGVLALTRDVSELRSRDRLLVSKDATIREIHHRVKNNLQTIQSLLQLQSRRLSSAEAKAAVAQSARRIGSIAIVHETLATDATDEVEFDTVARRVVRLVQEGFASPDLPLRCDVEGRVGDLPGDVAMPLAVALVELVQNAVDHAPPGRGAVVKVELSSDRRDVVMRISDDGEGVPEGFSLDRDAGLGLEIVRTFVVSDLRGTITIGAVRDEDPRGTLVEIRVPRSFGEPAVVG